MCHFCWFWRCVSKCELPLWVSKNEHLQWWQDTSAFLCVLWRNALAFCSMLKKHFCFTMSAARDFIFGQWANPWRPILCETVNMPCKLYFCGSYTCGLLWAAWVTPLCSQVSITVAVTVKTAIFIVLDSDKRYCLLIRSLVMILGSWRAVLSFTLWLCSGVLWLGLKIH